MLYMLKRRVLRQSAFPPVSIRLQSKCNPRSLLTAPLDTATATATATDTDTDTDTDGNCR